MNKKMDKKNIILIVAVISVAALGFVIYNYNTGLTPTAGNNKQDQNVARVSNTPNVVQQAAADAQVKEFTMESFVKFIGEKAMPQFSVKEITVNKGDLVRIKITVTSGNHDFKIDEFGVYADTKLNQEAVIEFTADKAGEFVYYCTKSGHRQAGHWGTLKVI